MRNTAETEPGYVEKIQALAAKITNRHDQPWQDNLSEGVITILTAIGENAMSGTDQVADPESMSVEKCTLCACFMAGCSVPILSRLHEMNHTLDAVAIMHGAGHAVFHKFNAQDRKMIIDDGIVLFKDLVATSTDNRKMKEWLDSIAGVTEKYVATEGDTDNVDLFAPLYLVLLMATRQFKQQVQ